MSFFHAILLGIVEGLTEFLPVSSTAHLMLTAKLLGEEQTEFLKTFEIAIQPGAILAVVVLYWHRFLVERAVMVRILVAFVPTAVLGLLMYKTIKEYFLQNHALALVALGVGGVLLIVFELLHREKPEQKNELARLSYLHCFLIGCFQSLAFVPGVSRAAATIIGGLILGWNRKTAVEFSFLLAVPTMAAATAKDLYTNSSSISSDKFQLLSVGFVTSFVVALLAIKFLLFFIRTHTFIPFGIYRIIFAGAVALWLLMAA